MYIFEIIILLKWKKHLKFNFWFLSKTWFQVNTETSRSIDCLSFFTGTLQLSSASFIESLLHHPCLRGDTRCEHSSWSRNLWPCLASITSVSAGRSWLSGCVQLQRTPYSGKLFSWGLIFSVAIHETLNNFTFKYIFYKWISWDNRIHTVDHIVLSNTQILKREKIICFQAQKTSSVREWTQEMKGVVVLKS